MTARLTPWLSFTTAVSSVVLTSEPALAVEGRHEPAPLAAVAANSGPETTSATTAKPDASGASGASAASDGDVAADAMTSDEPTADAPESAATPGSKDAAIVADAEAGGSPVELPGKTYYGLGLRYRAVIVPKFMMNLFGDGGKTVLEHGVGPEFTIRRNAFEYGLSAWFVSYALSPTAFKAKSDPATAWEVVESKIKVIYLTSDFIWSHDITPEFGFNYGLGAGLGLVFGDLRRTQAYPKDSTANLSTGEGFLPCRAAGDPSVGGYCGDDNDHYPGYTEPNWANGGSKPIVFPWLALQTGFRYKPHRNFIARFDAGFGTSGFFLGVGADYGL